MGHLRVAVWTLPMSCPPIALVIAAPADFVGRLREVARGALQKSVVREIIGDYTNDSVQALQERARRHEWLH